MYILHRNQKYVTFHQYTKKYQKLNPQCADLSQSLSRGQKYLLITSKLANLLTLKVLFTCVVYTNYC